MLPSSSHAHARVTVLRWTYEYFAHVIWRKGINPGILFSKTKRSNIVNLQTYTICCLNWGNGCKGRSQPNHGCPHFSWTPSYKINSNFRECRPVPPSSPALCHRCRSVLVEWVDELIEASPKNPDTCPSTRHLSSKLLSTSHLGYIGITYSLTSNLEAAL